MNKFKSKNKFKSIALKRIAELFNQAELRYKESPELSDRYVEIARKIGMKYNVSIPKEYRHRFCKNCHKFLVPGSNCRIRLTKKKVVCFCYSCKHHIRTPYY